MGQIYARMQAFIPEILHTLKKNATNWPDSCYIAEPVK
jgi:hypothetical protein